MHVYKNEDLKHSFITYEGTLTFKNIYKLKYLKSDLQK
jgi:hypothetical protein